MDAVHDDKREIFATTKEDLEHEVEHSIGGQQACHAVFIRVTTGITPSGVFFPL